MTNKENIIATLQLHKSELSKFGVQNIGLFGSYLRNQQTSNSDIDLLITLNREKKTLTITWLHMIYLKPFLKIKGLKL